MNFKKFFQKTGITTQQVAYLCETTTNPANGTDLGDWLAEGDYDGNETAESLAAEWDSLNPENN